MNSMKPSVQEIYLQPGEYFWGGENNRVKTLLGSCVAICIWHPRFKIGGMSHCLLPSRGSQGGEQPQAELSGKYVDECLEIFFREMVRAGTRKQDYVVKVFGGGNMFELKDPSGATVGERNIEMLKVVLAREGISIAAQHLGGKGHRNVIFQLWNGDCWVKHADLLLPTGHEET
ncbi:chemotaxis protein CheD [Turneriella parva]|uniref:Probable chemoreceptor glutamine deamidase CheD n=1 Tax=Turneriella parva (strain ATCC BAA-1111 / DSM 21527 / NCTC 11395 / H) TaxID=869212 RepID=I4B1E8_TURPD|nr:chemotaxis protein CheD [Turneriella parva]AFM11105.1 CheD [Turneriella parva DSM 21527]